MIARYPDLQGVRRILVAKLRHHGDVLLTTPLFTILKERFPEASIDAYIYQETLPMLEGHVAIDGFLLYDKKLKKSSWWKRVWHECSLLWQIVRKRYDLVINLTEGDRGALVAWLSGARIRMGFDPEGSGMWGKRKCYTHLVRICHQTRHTVERHLDLLRGLGIFPKEDERELSFFIPQEAYQRVRELLKAGNILEDQPFILVHPVSRWLFKCLPEATVAGVIRYLHQRGHKIVLTASSDPLELAMNEKILALVPEGSVFHLGGKISLKELGALIDLSTLLLCVDSVPLHMASALKAPAVAIFGPTSEQTWAPWNNPHARVITSKKHPCRPCYMPGCGGSGRSDCLETLSVSSICLTLDDMLVSSKESQNVERVCETNFLEVDS